MDDEFVRPWMMGNSLVRCLHLWKNRKNVKIRRIVRFIEYQAMNRTFIEKLSVEIA